MLFLMIGVGFFAFLILLPVTDDTAGSLAIAIAFSTVVYAAIKEVPMYLNKSRRWRTRPKGDRSLTKEQWKQKMRQERIARSSDE